MKDPSEGTTSLMRRAQGGDQQARNRLIARACERLRRLTGRMLKGYPGVRRWEQTDDVLNNALLRLHKALSCMVPGSSQHFWNLATLEIRRELIDLARHYMGPEGEGANHHTDRAGKAADDEGGILAAQADRSAEPSSLLEWTLFHEEVEKLPEEEREVVSLLWYEGLTQEESAGVLGVSLRTVKRRWQEARILLSNALKG